MLYTICYLLIHSQHGHLQFIICWRIAVIDTYSMWQLYLLTHTHCGHFIYWHILDVAILFIDTYSMWPFYLLTHTHCGHFIYWHILDVAILFIDTYSMWPFYLLTHTRCGHFLYHLLFIDIKSLWPFTIYYYMSLEHCRWTICAYWQHSSCCHILYNLFNILHL